MESPTEKDLFFEHNVLNLRCRQLLNNLFQPIIPKTMKTKFTLFMMVFLYSMTLSAQCYKGKVCDAENKQPLMGATVQLFNKQNVFVCGALTNADGTFSVQATKDSIAKVAVSYIGYARYMKQDEKSLQEDLGTIMLQAGQTLSDVVVTGHQKKQNIDTDQYLVTEAMRQGTLNASQLLAKLPGVRRDWVTDEIQINGEKDVVLLVNDVEKPQDYIREVNPKRIAYVDITYRPTGKYAGHAVLVNLRLKDDYVGWDFTPLTRDAFFFNNKNGGFLTFFAPFTYSLNKWNFYVSPNYRVNHCKNASSLETEYTDKYKKKSLGKVDLAHPNDINHFYDPSITLGVDYRIAKDHTLSLQMEGEWTDVKNRTSYDLEATDSAQTGRASQASYDNYKTNEYTVGLFYSGQIKNINIKSDISYNNYAINENRLYSETGMSDNVNLTHGKKDFIRYYFNAAIPFAKKWNFNVDYSLMWRKYINTNQTTNEEIYTSINNRNRVGGMLSYQPTDNFSIRVGMGWNSVIDRNTSGRVSHTTWEPGGSLFWKPFNILTCRVDYTCNTSYPSLDQLSTNQYNVDKWMIHIGNPFLKQTVAQQIYSTVSIDKWFTLYQKTFINQNSVNDIYSKNADGMIVESNFNVDRSQFTYGITGQYQLLKGLMFNEDISYYAEKLKNDAYGCNLNGHGFTMRSELNYMLQRQKLSFRLMHIYVYNNSAVFQGDNMWGLNTMMFTVVHAFFKDNMPVALNIAVPIDNMNDKRHDGISIDGYSTKKYYTDQNNSGFAVMLVAKYKFGGGKSTRKSDNSFNNDTEKKAPSI